MDDEQRVRTLERDLGRLEGIVETLAASMKLESEMQQRARVESRKELAELAERMEKAVSGLADEVKKLVKESARQDAMLTQHRAQQDGAIGFSRWLVATGIAVAALAASWLGSRSGTADIHRALQQYREAEGKPGWLEEREHHAQPEQRIKP